jgi:tetratricopeptide (TPR) repeat protein
MINLKIVSVVLILLLLNEQGYSSNRSKVDSLLQVLGTKGEDTSKVNLLIKLSSYYNKRNPDSALVLARQATELSKKLNFKIGIASGNLMQAESFLNKNEIIKAEEILTIAYNQFTELVKKNSKDYSAIKGLAGANGTFANLEESKGNLEKSLAYNEKSLALKIRNGEKQGAAFTYNNIGINHSIQGKFYLALENYYKALEINKELGNRFWQAYNLSNIAGVYEAQGKFALALKIYFELLKINEEEKEPLEMAHVYLQIGNLFFRQIKLNEAEEYYNKAKKIFDDENNKSGLADYQESMAAISGKRGLHQKAIEELMSSVNMKLTDGDSISTAMTYLNIGSSYVELKDFEKGLEYLQKALKIWEKVGNMYNIPLAYINIGATYMRIKKYALAESYFKKAIDVSNRVGLPDYLKESYANLSSLDSVQGNFKEALIYHHKFILLRDSLYSKEQSKKMIEAEMQYQFEKKEATTKALQEKKNVLATAESKKQKVIRNAFIVGFILMLLLALVIFKNYKRKQKDNQLITEQKLIVEIKNKEILSSIEYAKRIQTAILPPPRVVKEYLKNSFILYLPKDIVAGDFYWMEHADNNIYLAACDCTGHGVPGALVSVVCNNALNRSLNEFGERMPGKIFDKTREIVLESFEKSDEEVKDGMDASLAVLNLESKKIWWSGANNPLWIYRHQTHMIEEIKADKQPIGKGYESKPFTTHEIEIQTGDAIYLFTDGFSDQFGGERNKKITKSKFKEIILETTKLNMDEQLNALIKYYDKYKGDNEQIDDVCVIGVRV